MWLEHQATAAILVVVPVILIAMVSATGPAVAAALSAGFAYDLFRTEPFYRLRHGTPGRKPRSGRELPAVAGVRPFVVATLVPVREYG